MKLQLPCTKLDKIKATPTNIWLLAQKSERFNGNFLSEYYLIIITRNTNSIQPNKMKNILWK